MDAAKQSQVSKLREAARSVPPSSDTRAFSPQSPQIAPLAESPMLATLSHMPSQSQTFAKETRFQGHAMRRDSDFSLVETITAVVQPMSSKRASGVYGFGKHPAGAAGSPLISSTRDESQSSSLDQETWQPGSSSISECSEAATGEWVDGATFDPQQQQSEGQADDVSVGTPLQRRGTHYGFM
eukprot:m.253201 g.253201  ORF g.253201 m.253201 type:complete len:183 (+) comp19579_c0_seq3:377-925(+)